MKSQHPIIDYSNISAIWTALSAAPLRTWSPQTKMSNLLRSFPLVQSHKAKKKKKGKKKKNESHPWFPSWDISRRILPTATSSLFDISKGVGKELDALSSITTTPGAVFSISLAVSCTIKKLSWLRVEPSSGNSLGFFNPLRNLIGRLRTWDIL